MTTSYPSVRRLLALLWLFLALLGSSFAAEAPKKSFDVPAGTADKALKQLSTQAGVEVVYASALTRNVKTKAVQGQYSAKEAMDRMLEGTGLVGAEDAQTGALTVRKETADEAKNAFSRPVKSSDRAAKENVADDTTRDGVIKLDTFEVMGSKLLNMDIRRTPDDPQPYIVFDRNAIDRSGAVDLQDFLRKRLSMDTLARTSQQQAGGQTAGNTSLFTLRGLSAKETLILVDGHRMPAAYSGSFTTQGDINSIPLAAIERIDVLTSTGSGIYGGSATGGVINVILRRDYTGLDVRLTYQNSFHGDTTLRSANLAAGITTEGGKTNILLALSYSMQNGMTFGEGQFTQSYVNRIIANSGNDYASLFGTVPPNGTTTNIRSADGSNLTLKTGQALGSPYTFVPDGYASTATDGGLALVANAGKYNLKLPPGSGQTSGNLIAGALRPMLGDTTAKSLSFTVRREFSPHLQVFLDSQFSTSSGGFMIPVGAPGSRAVSIPVSVATNPFNQAIVVSFPVPYNWFATTKNESSRVVGGMILELPQKWKLEADYAWARNLFTLADSSPYSGITGLPLLGAAITAGTVDPLKDLRQYPISYLGFDTAIPGADQLVFNPWIYAENDVTLRASGPVWELPAGEINLSVQAEHLLSETDDALFRTGTTLILYPASSQTADSASVETTVPLFSKKNERPLARSLDVQLAGRWDRYRTTGSTTIINPTSATIVIPNTNRFSATSYTAGLRYEPIRDFALRASYATGFLPPDPSQLTPSAPSNTSSGALDPRRGFTAIPLPFTTQGGGNPNLKPEHSKSVSAGIIFTPRFISGLRISVDYSRILKTDAIANPTVTDILNNEAFVPTRVIRGPKLPGDPVDWAGPVTQVDITRVNLSSRKIEAYDFAMNYDLATTNVGKFELFANGTWTLHDRSRFAPNSTELDNVRSWRDILKFRANGGLTWTDQEWTIGWSTRYYGSYPTTSLSDAPATAALFLLRQGGDHVSSQIFHDFFVSYKLGSSKIAKRWEKGWMDGMEISTGINNVFNVAPAFDARDTAVFYSVYADPRGAVYWMTLKKSF